MYQNRNHNHSIKGDGKKPPRLMLNVILLKKWLLQYQTSIGTLLSAKKSTVRPDVLLQLLNLVHAFIRVFLCWVAQAVHQSISQKINVCWKNGRQAIYGLRRENKKPSFTETTNFSINFAPKLLSRDSDTSHHT